MKEFRPREHESESLPRECISAFRQSRHVFKASLSESSRRKLREEVRRERPSTSTPRRGFSRIRFGWIFHPRVEIRSGRGRNVFSRNVSSWNNIFVPFPRRQPPPSPSSSHSALEGWIYAPSRRYRTRRGSNLVFVAYLSIDDLYSSDRVASGETGIGTFRAVRQGYTVDSAREIGNDSLRILLGDFPRHAGASRLRIFAWRNIVARPQIM